MGNRSPSASGGPLNADMDVRDWRVFGEDGRGGNRARTFACTRPLPAAERQRLARQTPAATCCFFWAAAGDDGRHYQVHCHNAQNVIQRCGHGYLAVARALPLQDASLPITLLASDNTPITIEATGIGLEVHLPRIPCQPDTLPVWAQSAFSPAPVSAARAGDDEGYLILEWDPAVDLARVSVGIAMIAASSRRAVVATRAGAGTDFDFLLRYFAPRHGVDEDPVTGSANAVLADYWGQQHGQTHFRARQCSATGGVVYSRLTDHSVAISGQVEAWCKP